MDTGAEEDRVDRIQVARRSGNSEEDWMHPSRFGEKRRRGEGVEMAAGVREAGP